MTHIVRFSVFVLLTMGLLASVDRPIQADAAQGDKAGWQLYIEGSGETEHQFLAYVQRDNGPRLLTFACERDIDTFGFYSEDLGELSGPIARASMTLSSGKTNFNIPGSIQAAPDTQAVSFVAEIPQSAPVQQERLANALAALLLTGEPVRMAFGPKSRELPPVKGMLDPAKRFLRSCFSAD
jgi:hypothetical protein